jgi:putative membrane protein
VSDSSQPDPEFGDPTRRTFLAQERTLLAWWRTACAAIGVALAVGRLLPEIAHLPKGPFLALGTGWGVLASGLVTFGLVRHRAGERAIRAGSYLHLSPHWLVVFTVYMLALMAATIPALFLHFVRTIRPQPARSRVQGLHHQLDGQALAGG